MSSKIRLALAGLTAAALIGGVMVADPADAGKKKKHKKVKVVKVKKVKKVQKGDSVKQVSKGGNAQAGNGGNGGAGGSSGNVHNTGNVGGGGAGAGLTDAEAACIGAAFALADAADAPLGEIDGPITPEFVAGALTAANCGVTPADIPAALLACVQAADDPVLTTAEALGCLDSTAGVPAGAGSVFSGNGGSGGTGGAGGNATGGAGGSNSNTNTVTVTHDDHSIDVG